ncbi:hypothetical protein ANCDUO_11224 [Ancylostoma duodenale]|uniref:Uncharacterized protein n=1 Tax=Ancylostoma duodenale TaxID=51022 RepID=A0A0C2GNJ2_9BILA|nr:hypothetical protein ANCDUO_11224 [Ancylostoma duodenale]
MSTELRLLPRSMHVSMRIRAEGDKCVALPPPPTTTPQPNIAIIPGVAVPRSNDLFKLFGQIFGGGGANNAIGSFING